MPDLGGAAGAEAGAASTALTDRFVDNRNPSAFIKLNGRVWAQAYTDPTAGTHIRVDP